MVQTEEEKGQLQKITSGVDGLDELLGGGLIKNRSLLVCGLPGTGKSTFAFQFLCEGARLGEPGAYVSFDEEEAKLITNASQFGWDIESFKKKDLLRVQKVGALEIQQFASQESILLIEIIRSIGAKRVAVDSLTSYELLFKEDYERMLYVKRLCDEILGRGCTMLATSESIPGKLSRFEISEFIFDSLIKLDFDRSSKTGRTLEIIKHRGSRHKLGPVPMELSETGLAVRSR